MSARTPRIRPTLLAGLAVVLIAATAAAREPRGVFEAGARRESPPKRATIAELEARAGEQASRATVPNGMRLGGAPVRRMGGAGVESTGPGGLAWTAMGPAPMYGDYWSSGQPTSGRVSCVAVDPTNGLVAYTAAAQGGIWKTTDGGASWTPITDALPTLASGWVEIDPAAPNVLFYGTGEQHYSLDSFYGDGLFKSTDAGATWTKLADDAIVGAYISRVRLRPGDPGTILVGGSNGLVRSTDGGVSWTATLPVSWCDDIAIHPSAPETVFATCFASGMFRSTDGGATWALVEGGLPTENIDRGHVVIAPGNRNVMYASFATPSGTVYGVYRSNDAGDTWTELTVPEYMGGQGWYDQCLVVHPTNVNLVFAGGVYPYNVSLSGIIRSTNGGATWTDVTAGSPPGNYVHPDQHVLAYGPDGALWLGNDGGVWKSTNNGSSWTPRNDGLDITQFYTVGLHPTDPTDLLGGTQDNGTVRYAGSTIWPMLVSGDGGPVLYESAAPNYFYSTYVFLTYLSRYDDGSYLGDVTGPWQANGDPADWANGPLVEDPSASGTLFVGTNRVYRSTNSGGSWSPISGPVVDGGGVLLGMAVAPGAPGRVYTSSSDGAVFVSDDLVNWIDRSAGLPVARRLTNVVVDPDDPDHAWVSVDRSNGGRVYRTTDAGLTWQDRTANLAAGHRGLALAVDFRTDPERVYLGTDYGVHASLDSGATWAAALDGMPKLAVYDLAIDAANDLLVAATHGRGMFRSVLDRVPPAVTLTAPNGGEAWPVGEVRNVTWTASDLSGVASVDLEYSGDGGATWSQVLATGLPNTGSFAWTVNQAPTTLARVRAVARDPSTNAALDASDADFSIVTTPTAVGDGAPAAFALHAVRPNPGRGPFDVRFALPAAGAVRIEVFDAAGRRVRGLASGTWNAGEHSVRWDGRDDAGSDAGDGLYFVRMRAGAFAGTARVALIR